MHELHDKYKDQSCYIVGKGPSLNLLHPKYFGQGPIICLNESIEFVERLELDNDVYSMQQDGKSQCMRRPKKAPLLLSTRSSAWYPDHQRFIYDQQKDLNVRDKSCSAVSAVSLANIMGCREIVLLCFDACTDNNATYPQAKNYWSDPFNSLKRFLQFCGSVKLASRLPLSFYSIFQKKSFPVNIGNYTAITVTGNRTPSFQLLRQYMLKQTILPAQWIVIDDGYPKLPMNISEGSEYYYRKHTNDDPKNTMARNMRIALRHVDYEYILNFDDDDWYAEDYAETMLHYLQGYDLVGVANVIYYHVPSHQIAQLDNKDHSSTASTGFHRRVIPILDKICQEKDTPLMDVYLWKNSQLRGNVIKTGKVIYVGLKGLPGRAGVAQGHNPAFKRYRNDPDYKNLRLFLGEHINHYKPYMHRMPFLHLPKGLSKSLNETLKGMTLRQALDGTYYLPRANKKVIAILDTIMTRVPGELRWYPASKVVANKILDLRPIFEGKPCYVIGKGPSLDNITSTIFEHPDAPICCINESIHTIENLHIPNPLFVLQQDTKLKATCRPRRATMILSQQALCFYLDVEDKYLFVPYDFGIVEKYFTAGWAIGLAKTFGSTKVIMIAFDAHTNKVTEYAKSVGYSATKGGDPNRFIRQGARMERITQDIETIWIRPEDLALASVDIPQP